MHRRDQYDAVVVGAGPNGLAAAIALAHEGWSVLVLEAKDTVGGGVRSAELTLPGFTHDVCSAIFPLSLASPFIRSLPLEEHGLEWIHPLAPVVHPLDGGDAVLLEHSLEEMVVSLGEDGDNYRRMVATFHKPVEGIGRRFTRPAAFTSQAPIPDGAFRLDGGAFGEWLGRAIVSGRESKGNFCWQRCALHSAFECTWHSRLRHILMSVFAHTVGWPMVRGGAQNLANALRSYFCSLGGELVTGFPVNSLDQLPSARIVMLDVTPDQFLRIAGDRLPHNYRRRLERYRYGSGVFKVDYALAGPAPWSASECTQAATVHLGGTLEEIASAEAAVWRGEHPEKPFVLFVQQSLFDPRRAPERKHTAWAYCHVPNGSTVDMTRQIEDQIERFAPGFRDLILARHTHNTAQMQAYNPNYIGGDIIGGVQDLRQQFFRPIISINPYATPLEGVYLCSSSTPPGGGVHGMCGYHAAQTVLRA